MGREAAVDRICALLNAADARETPDTPGRIPAPLLEAAALAERELGAALPAAGTATALRSALEGLVMQAALDEHYRQYEHARPDLGDLAVASAEIDGHPLAARPDLLRQAAAEISGRHPGVTPEEVVRWAEARGA